jgi:hypothetical protein
MSALFGGVGVPGQHATLARPDVTLARNILSPTPAQANGHPNFVTDVPVQGPTDQGMREASCWFAQNRLPAHPACVDCKGPIPMWAQSKGLLGNEWGSLGGVRAPGFALEAPGDPEVWTKLTDAQRAWVANVFNRLNGLILKGGSSPCPTWKPSPSAEAGACIQRWFNSTYANRPPAGIKMPLRTDGVFDQDTFWATMKIIEDNSKDFPEPWPGSPGAIEAEKSKGLSAGAMTGIAVVGAAAIGGIIYVATSGKARRKAGKRK